MYCCFHFHLGLSAFLSMAVQSFTWFCKNFELPVFEHDHMHDMLLSFDGTHSLNSLECSCVCGIEEDQVMDPPSNLARLWQLLRETNSEHLAPILISHGVRAPEMLVLEAESLISKGVAKTDLETLIAGCSRPDPVANRGRADHPTWIQHGGRASLVLALQAAQSNNRRRALEFLEQDIIARSSQPALQSRLRTWRALCAAWEVVPFPLTFANVKAVAASLKWGGYGSAQLYFQAAIGHQSRALQMPVDPFIRALVKDVCRSIRRGLGPSSLKEGFDMAALVRAVDMDDDSPFDAARISHAADMMIIGCWFMTREIELSFATNAHLYLEGPYVNLVLPVHKTNTTGGLTLRRLKCPCRVQVHNLCPWHSAERHLIRVAAMQPDSYSQFTPLFPDHEGRPISKHMMIQMIRKVLQTCGVPTTRSDGSSPPKQLFGGHCLRVSGAQYLAASGVSTSMVQLLGRWSSSAVEKYIQAAPLALVPELPEQILAEGQPQLWTGAASSMTDSNPPSGPRYISEPTDVPMGFDPQLMEDDMKRLASQLADVKSMIETPLDHLVVRPRQNVMHLGTQFERINNPQLWRTKCGWNYGVSRFFRIPHMSDEFRQCRKCFEQAEAQQAASSESDSQSDESSGSESSELSE